MPERWLVFLGPSLDRTRAEAILDADYRPPVTFGQLPAAVAEGYRHVAIIDGEFAQSRAVTVIEIREAIRAGVRVVGASSMGALRAAETDLIGMTGSGWIYRRYASGDFERDDEVALTFDPWTHAPVTVPLVNVRWTCQLARERGLIAPDVAARLVALAGALDYRRRTYELIVKEAAGSGGPELLAAATAIAGLDATLGVAADRKALDAIELLERLRDGLPRQPIADLDAVMAHPRAPLPAREVLLSSAAQSRKHAGSHRQLSGPEALERARQDGARVGVSRLADISHLDQLGAYSFSSIRPLADPLAPFTVTGGKGFDERTARLSALLEAVERACAEVGDRRLERGTLAEMRQSRLVLNPRALVIENASPWHEEVPLCWTPTRDVIGGEEVWIPADAVFFPYPYAPEAKIIHPHTGGISTGASWAEAILYGLLEVIERDGRAFAECLRGGRRIELATVREPRIARILERLAARRIVPHAWLFDTDFGIPLVYVVIDDQLWCQPMYVNGGFACHLDTRQALESALLEALYSRLTNISGGREDLQRKADGVASLGHDDCQAFIASLGDGGPPATYDDLVDVSTGSIGEDLDRVLEGVRRAGMTRVLVAPLSPPELSFSVVRVIVPGAEVFPYRDRIGPRLYRRALAARNEQPPSSSPTDRQATANP